LISIIFLFFFFVFCALRSIAVKGEQTKEQKRLLFDAEMKVTITPRIFLNPIQIVKKKNLPREGLNVVLLLHHHHHRETKDMSMVLPDTPVENSRTF
jgi:hypothetical protein